MQNGVLISIPASDSAKAGLTFFNSSYPCVSYSEPEAIVREHIIKDDNASVTVIAMLSAAVKMNKHDDFVKSNWWLP